MAGNAPKTLDELLAEYEPERLADVAKDDAYLNRPDVVARREARQKEQADLIKRQIKQGIRHPDGSLVELDPDDDDTDEA